MENIKYSYALTKIMSLFTSVVLQKKNKRNHTYRCLQYHKTLIAKIGNKKVPHFAHKKGNACNEKSYLHKLAKRRIREKIIPNAIFELNLLRS